MAIRQEGNTYYGLSTDTKPTGAVLNGREFREMDTGKKYLFDEENGKWLEQPEEGGGGGGGSSTLAGLTDVDISNPTDGQTLVYNATSGKWENGAGCGCLIVTVDADNDYQADKTCREIYEAQQHGVVMFRTTEVSTDIEPDSQDEYTETIHTYFMPYKISATIWPDEVMYGFNFKDVSGVAASIYIFGSDDTYPSTSGGSGSGGIT